MVQFGGAQNVMKSLMIVVLVALGWKVEMKKKISRAPPQRRLLDKHLHILKSQRRSQQPLTGTNWKIFALTGEMTKQERAQSYSAALLNKPHLLNMEADMFRTKQLS